ncbi:zinc metallochaperone AztD [Pseudarthrobacter sp. J75]|uniref:zinc metallochaperone AztD n=1 Tax=unclassified Pseudarthrobacter TaxID=2647000 RepID=UPI002E8231BC|nr:MULTISPECIES: zinc metallochaperone AztD [unclassified Pseudarthrobacter]MEE2522484.1 zinc metallochaperone AztD [Pseudarthrobacter sp. J47]MEE2529185.1 zinc metallochaperone AztD [Pseudarthrobacter sp. J75]
MKDASSPHLQRLRPLGLAAAVTASVLMISACGSAAGTSPGTAEPATSTAPAASGPRVALTYDGGIAVLDGESLALTGDLPIEGFNRLNPAGDGRHAMVTTTAGFQVLDLATPELTDLVFEADAAGHVVRHGGKTILYADGTSDTTIFESDDLLDGGTSLPKTEVVPADEAHHGVSILLKDNTLLTTVGNSESRSGIRVLDADRKETARNDECPSVHGEGTAANEVVVFGCNNGVLVYDAGTITKITAPDEYGRMGNAYVTEDSTLAVGDYNSDPDSEGYLLHELALIDTAAKTMKVVELPEGVEYTWRDVARGPAGEILLLASDGSLHTLDPATGAITNSVPVVDAWEGPAEWQDPHPALTVLEGTAYVTDPAKKVLHAVDLATGKVTTSEELPGVPNEITAVEG